MKKLIPLLAILVLMGGCSIKTTNNKELGHLQDQQASTTTNSQANDNANGSPNSFYPLSKGSYWIYRITGEQLIDNGQGNKLIETNKLFKVEVLNYTKRDPNLQAIILTGFPSLGNYETSTLIVEADKDYYLIAGAEAFNKILDKQSDLSDLYSGAIRILSLPLTVNKKIDCISEGERDDNYYCNWVKSIKPADAKLYPNKNEYKIAFYTNPDSTDYSYVNDVGITYFSYHHNGSLDDEQWNLVKYFIAK